MNEHPRVSYCSCQRCKGAPEPASMAPELSVVVPPSGYSSITPVGIELQNRARESWRANRRRRAERVLIRRHSSLAWRLAAAYAGVTNRRKGRAT